MKEIQKCGDAIIYQKKKGVNRQFNWNLLAHKKLKICSDYYQWFWLDDSRGWECLLLRCDTNAIHRAAEQNNFGGHNKSKMYLIHGTQYHFYELSSSKKRP